jgi:hypothetical protein
MTARDPLTSNLAFARNASSLTPLRFAAPRSERVRAKPRSHVRRLARFGVRSREPLQRPG